MSRRNMSNKWNPASWSPRKIWESLTSSRAVVHVSALNENYPLASYPSNLVSPLELRRAHTRDRSEIACRCCWIIFVSRVSPRSPISRSRCTQRQTTLGFRSMYMSVSFMKVCIAKGNKTQDSNYSIRQSLIFIACIDRDVGKLPLVTLHRC